MSPTSQQAEALIRALEEFRKSAVKCAKSAATKKVLRMKGEDLVDKFAAALRAPAAAPEPRFAAAPAPPRAAERADEAEPDTFADFFESIGSSFVSTQRRLDHLSSAYLDAVRDNPHVLPSVFRMPNLEAKMKVGLTEQEGNRVGLFLFSSKEQLENQREQEISFELAAVPPPHEVLDWIRSGAPRLRMVLASDERTAIFRRIARCLADDAIHGRFDGTETERTRAAGVLGRDSGGALIVGVGAEDLIILGVAPLGDSDDAPRGLEVWHLGREPLPRVAGQPEGEVRWRSLLAPVFQANEAEGESTARVVRLVDAASERQRTLLRESGRA
jgi:hypothetical protein